MVKKIMGKIIYDEKNIIIPIYNTTSIKYRCC